MLALLPVLAVIAFRVGHHVVLLGDEASVDLRVRDVFTSNTPLVGAYSRGFNHPGPLLYWLLAPLSVLTGGAAWATVVGGAVLQGIAIAASGWLAFRRGGVVLALGVLAALGLAYSSFALGDQFLQPWNPYIVFPFFMLYLLQVWSITVGSRWQVLGAAITGTLLVQFHVGYLPVVVAPAIWAAVIVVLDRRRDTPLAVPGALPRWRTVTAWTTGALVVLWSPAVYQQLTRTPGNVSALLSFFRHAGDTAGLGTGAGIYAAEFRIPPPWLGGVDHLEFLSDRVRTAGVAWLLVAVVVLAVGFVASHRSGRRNDQRMLQLATVSALTSIVAISRVNVALQEFLFYWRVISAVFVVLAAAWAVAHWARLDQRGAARAVTVAVLLLLIAGFFGVRARDDVWLRRHALGPRYEYADRLFRQVADDAPDGRVLVRGVGASTSGFAQGLVDDLDRSGVQVRVDPDDAYQYGDERAARRADVDEVWYVSSDGSYRSLLDQYPQARLVASQTPLGRARERELRSLQRSMVDQLSAAGRPELAQYVDSSLFSTVVEDVDGLDERAVDRLSDLNRRVEASGGCRCVVIAFPADDAPDLPSTVGF